MKKSYEHTGRVRGDVLENVWQQRLASIVRRYASPWHQDSRIVIPIEAADTPVGITYYSS